MKNFALVFLSSIVFISSASAESIFSPEERYELISHTIPEGLSPVWNDPHVKACWEDAKSGNDNSLAALYLIVDSRQAIDEVAAKRKKALASASTPGEAYKNLKDSFDVADLKRVKRATRILPKSWKYCEELYEKING